MMEEEIVFLTIEEAEKMLPNRDVVHTLRQGGIALIGCDWNKQDVIDTMKKFNNTIQLSGENATSMGHGIVLKDDRGWLFIETIKDGE